MQAELEEEESLAKQREEDANIAEWDNVQTMMDVDYELAARLQEQEQEELTIEESSKLFVELMDKRKKHFARLRAEEQRRKLSTKKQKMDDDKEKEELKQCFEIVPDDGDDVTIDATSLSVKIPIVDYKIYQEGKKIFF
ncbi:hypothetical protein Tco_0373226, partial [Tanacetum coccineum]